MEECHYLVTQAGQAATKYAHNNNGTTRVNLKNPISLIQSEHNSNQSMTVCVIIPRQHDRSNENKIVAIQRVVITNEPMK